jgi:ribonuclease VapC
VTVFGDASALIAIIANEIDAVTLTAQLQACERRLYSAVSAWETVAGLSRSYRMSDGAARTRFELFMAAGRFTCVSIGAEELRFALEAHARYGKGRHPAALNMGDCLAYACAKANQAKLLYKGGDFAKTDMA